MPDAVKEIVKCDIEVTMGGTFKVKLFQSDIDQANGDLNEAAKIALESNGFDCADGLHILGRLDVSDVEVTSARIVADE